MKRGKEKNLGKMPDRCMYDGEKYGSKKFISRGGGVNNRNTLLRSNLIFVVLHPMSSSHFKDRHLVNFFFKIFVFPV